MAREDDNYLNNGNMLFNRMLGAQVHTFELEDFEDGRETLLASLSESGKTVYQIPAGGSNAIGAVGYSHCLSELVAQAPFKLSQIVHASASAGTQAGLVFANAVEHYNIDILGINVFHPDPESLRQRINGLYHSMSERFNTAQAPKEPAIDINHAYFGSAYGQPTEAAKDAIRMFAESEGLLLDPVYSGKAAAGLIDQITLGNFDQHENVVFIHTGGATSERLQQRIFRWLEHCLTGVHATTGEQGLTSEVTGLITGQKQRGIGNFFGLTKTLHGRHLHHRCNPFWRLADTRGHRGLYKTRSNRVYSNVFSREFSGKHVG